MKNRLAISTLAALFILATVLVTGSPAYSQGATRIGGVGFFADDGECEDAEGNGSDFALKMTGDLEGCHYVFVQDWACSPSGSYRETGTEIFVGQYDGKVGSFTTSYVFTAKLGDCSDLTTEIRGRCQHPIVGGSGIGDFEGVTGRFDIKDDVAAGSFPYKGHLRW
jgi:hypothetical protein